MIKRSRRRHVRRRDVSRKRKKIKRTKTRRLFSFNTFSDVVPDDKTIVSFVSGKPSTFYMSKKSKNMFKKLQELPFETGGRLDFNLKHIVERALTRIGEAYSVSENFQDFEAEWHVHPTSTFDGRVEFSPPSPGDYMMFATGLAENISVGQPPTQVGLVFSKRLIYVFYFDYKWLDKKFKAKTRKESAKKYLRFLDRDNSEIYVEGFLDTKKQHDLYIKKSYEKYGVKVYTFRWTDPVKIRLAPREPLLENLSHSRREKKLRNKNPQKKKKSKK